METEHPFLLPRGYLAPDGRIHREGRLRLATARDEVAVIEDPRVRLNRAYAVVLLLSRTIVRLGDLEGDRMTPEVVEGLFSADLAYLQELYRQVNGLGPGSGRCPHCGKEI
jgi:hypothetical protein